MKIQKIIPKKTQKFSKRIKMPFIFKSSKSFKYIFIILMLLYLIDLIRFQVSPYNTKTHAKFFGNIGQFKRRAFDEYKPHKVFIEAHRGVNKIKFQNTKESIELAIKYGLDSFETDLWLSKDNVGVLVHGGREGDLTHYYKKTRNKVIYTNWKKLSKLRTKKNKLKMPKLEDIMKLAKNKIFMNLEIKDPRVNLVFPYVIKLIEKYDYFNQISLSSFNHNYYKKIIEYNKNNKFGKKLSFGFLYGGRSNQTMYPFNLPKTSLNLYWRKVTKEICDKAHANGMAVFAWFYMRENENEKIWQRLFDYGIDIICTNYPLRAIKFRKYYYKRKSRKKFI